MWPLVRADLQYHARTLAVFHALALLNVTLLLSIRGDSDTPPPIVWLPLLMQAALTFNLLYHERAERHARLYALLPLSPHTVAFARLTRFLLAVLTLSLISAWLLLDGGRSAWFALSVTLLTWTACLGMVLLFDRFGLTGLQVGLLLPGVALLALFTVKSWLPSTFGFSAITVTQQLSATLAGPYGTLLASGVLGVVMALHVHLAARRPLP